MKLAAASALLLASFALPVAQQGPSRQPAASAAIGLEIGQSAPAFAARDQFGQEQSNQTLKGSDGTVLLFFRSADW